MSNLAGWQSLFSILRSFSQYFIQIFSFLSSYSVLFLHCSLRSPKFSLLLVHPCSEYRFLTVFHFLHHRGSPELLRLLTSLPSVPLRRMALQAPFHGWKLGDLGQKLATASGYALWEAQGLAAFPEA